MQIASDFKIHETLLAVLPGLRNRATGYDITGAWPAEDLAALASIGAMRWAVPQAFGGDSLPQLELHLRYEAIASASLATALILSQRDSAVRFLEEANETAALNESGRLLAKQWLPALASGQAFTTIGIAQLTTSRQGGKPVLTAIPVEDGYQIDGLIPWSTGAARSDFIVAGAVVNDRRQILFVLPTDRPGVAVQPPMPLVALRASWTASIECRSVFLPEKYILPAPPEKALGGRKASVPIPQAFLATGLCRGGLFLIGQHDSDRARAAHQRLEKQLNTLHAELMAVCALPRDGQNAHLAAAIPRLRGACNDLAVRITQTAIALYKGSALLESHPAQRLAREAMFLLVWSCPNPVIDCTIDLLTADQAIDAAAAVAPL